MPDYSDLVLPGLLGRRTPVLREHADLVLPSYDGFGLANLPGSISAWLGGPALPCGPLAEVITSKFQNRYKRVVLLLVDALGYTMLQRFMKAGKADFWQETLPNAALFPITSICPSTTASALTTLLSGAAPSQHAYLGYEMWLKELGITINTILHTPIAYNGDIGSLAYAKFDPATFNKIEPLGKVFKTAGIESHAYQPASLVGSGLSLMQLGGANVHGYVSDSDLWVSIREELNRRPAANKFIYAYWPFVDTLMHRFGPDNERTMQAFNQFSNMLKACLFNGLKDWAIRDTLFLLTADHGAVYQPYYENNNIQNHPGLLENLAIMPTCEARLPFLYVKSGREQTVRDYFAKAWPGQYTLITREESLQAGLFGPKSNRPELQDRIGDLIAISHGDSYLWWPNKANTMQGRHGGLTADEMLVPLFGSYLK
ncbi:MAG TPA: alkaline phosphatase family protein [Anaerolineaceae bacterium]|nr:alkaline phosphatase family protein [Anaerolineaceae bacterium]